MKQHLRSSCWRRTAVTSWWSCCILAFPKMRFTPRSPVLTKPTVALTRPRGMRCPRPWSSRTSPALCSDVHSVLTSTTNINCIILIIGHVLKRSLRTCLVRLNSLNWEDSITVLHTTVLLLSSAAASMSPNSTKVSSSVRNQRRYWQSSVIISSLTSALQLSVLLILYSAAQ